jgi:flagellar biosynthesis GTPase FlhF
MLTEASDDTAEQKKDLEMEITRLESETLEERNQRKEEEDRKKEEAATVAKAERDRNCAEKEAEEAQSVAAKIAERDRKRAEKEAEEAQRVAKAAAKAAERDAKWTAAAEVDASIESMINGSVSFSKIASKLGNGLSTSDIKNRWYDHLKESSGITKPPVKAGRHSNITWTADVNALIVRMRADDISFAKIASKLGNGLKRSDIKNRWNRHLKDKRSE